MNMPWPVDVPLMKDEILSSWIVRTAFENGSYPLAWSWYLWGKRRVWTIDIDRFCPLTDMLKLVTPRVSLSSLESATLYPWLTKFVSNDLTTHKKAWPWLTNLGARNRDRTGGLRYCPECLMNSPVYYRRAWRFSWNHSCAIHKCILKDFCPVCSSPICPHKLKHGAYDLALCATCGYNLGDSLAHSSSENALKLQNLMNDISEDRIVALPWGMQSATELFETVRYLISFLNRAQAIRLSIDNTLLELLRIAPFQNPTHHASIERISIDHMHAFSDVVSRILEHDLVEFSDTLSLIGYSKRTFLSRLTLPVSSQILAILNRLPDGVKRPRRKPVSCTHAHQPTPREEVEIMWRELLPFIS